MNVMNVARKANQQDTSPSYDHKVWYAAADATHTESPNQIQFVSSVCSRICAQTVTKKKLKKFLNFFSASETKPLSESVFLLISRQGKKLPRGNICRPINLGLFGWIDPVFSVRRSSPCVFPKFPTNGRFMDAKCVCFIPQQFVCRGKKPIPAGKLA